jgi:hypothetical protein
VARDRKLDELLATLAGTWVEITDPPGAGVEAPAAVAPGETAAAAPKRQAQIKLLLRLTVQLRKVCDCMGRCSDGLADSAAETFDLSYSKRQILFASESLTMARDLIGNFEREFPAELDQRGCGS